VVRRIRPAITLFLLAPLVAEFLLGDLPIILLPALLVLAPMYGGGALLIREVARRAGRGWPTILVLGSAYAVFEEAFTTQTLFNPNYLGLHLRLLEPAYIPALGMGAWWTVFVLTLHTVWSISVSIALAEALFPDRRTTPWLGRFGLAVTSVLFALGAVASTLLTLRGDHFHASAAQFAGAALACVVLIAAAFRLPRASSARTAGGVPSPWLVGSGALAAGSAFLLIPKRWGWGAVGAYLALDLLVIVLVSLWSHRAGWDGRHLLALAGGAALAYAWHAFLETPAVGQSGMVDRVGNAVFAVGLVVLLGIASRRTASGIGAGTG
jgi:hypothetical protein